MLLFVVVLVVGGGVRFCVGLLYREYHPLELSNQPIRLPIFVQKVQLGDLTIEGVTVEDTLGRQVD